MSIKKIFQTFLSRRSKRYWTSGECGSCTPGGSHVRAAVGEGHPQHVVPQSLAGVVACNTEMVGALDTDPANPSLLGLLYGNVHGKVAHHGPQAVVAIHQGSGRCLSDNTRLSIWITNLEFSETINYLDLRDILNLRSDISHVMSSESIEPMTEVTSLISSTCDPIMYAN